MGRTEVRTRWDSAGRGCARGHRKHTEPGHAGVCDRHGCANRLASPIAQRPYRFTCGFRKGGTGAVQQGSLLLLEIFTKEFPNIFLDQLQIMQHGFGRRVSVLPGEKQRDVAEPRVSQVLRSQHDIVASAARGLKLFFFLREVRRQLGRRRGRSGGSGRIIAPTKAGGAIPTIMNGEPSMTKVEPTIEGSAPYSCCQAR